MDDTDAAIKRFEQQIDLHEQAIKLMQERIAVMQAAQGGAVIQRRPNNGKVWVVVPNPKWDWDNCVYRVKPEPKRIWIVTYANGLKRTHDTEPKSVLNAVSIERYIQEVD